MCVRWIPVVLAGRLQCSEESQIHAEKEGKGYGELTQGSSVNLGSSVYSEFSVSLAC